MGFGVDGVAPRHAFSGFSFGGAIVGDTAQSLATLPGGIQLLGSAPPRSKLNPGRRHPIDGRGLGPRMHRQPHHTAPKDCRWVSRPRLLGLGFKAYVTANGDFTVSGRLRARSTLVHHSADGATCSAPTRPSPCGYGKLSQSGGRRGEGRDIVQPAFTGEGTTGPPLR